jgi:hypothetical protein
MGLGGLASPSGLKRLSTLLHSLIPTLFQREKQPYPGPYALWGTSPGILFPHHEGERGATMRGHWR